MRILADVNVLISSTIGPLGTSRAILEVWRAGDFELFISPGMLTEVEQKLHYPRIRDKYRLTEEQINNAVEVLRAQAEFVLVAPATVASVTGDPEDDYVLATAVIGRAEYLVTGDHGLLALGSYQGVTIISPRDFLNILTAERLA